MSRLAVRFLGILSAVILAAPAGGQQTVATAPSAPPDPAHADGLLARHVTVHMTNVALRQVVDALARSAEVRILYRADLMDAAKPAVSLNVADVTLGAALQQLLSGTTMRAFPVADNAIMIRPLVADDSVAAGTIVGRVTDAADKNVRGQVAISIKGTKITTLAAEDGYFVLRGIPAGTHEVVARLVGYTMVATPVTVASGGMVTVKLVMRPVATKLTEVVTTALGNQRRLEVGNVIAHVNVDSIAREAPVASVTDLLSARVPGVQVISSSGLVGASPAIRIRGQGSMITTADPILIVDGVRQDSKAGNTGFINGFGGSVLQTPSRINDIDINQIESIDILKGPAASTEYGTDAANGVIVITTKRGKAGSPQWHVSADRGWSEVPTDFPDFYYAYGHTKDAVPQQVACPLLTVPTYAYSLAAGNCIQDSLIHDNPMNHKDMSIYGIGLGQSVNLDVSGGTNAIRYFVGIGSGQQDGTTRLPDVFRAQAIAMGFPSSSMDPNTMKQQSARANLTAQLSNSLDFTVNGSMMSTNALTPGSTSLTLMSVTGPVVLDSAHNYGYGNSMRSTPLAGLASTSNQQTKRATAGASLDWRPVGWFSAGITGGVDHGSQRSFSFQPPQLNQLLFGAGNGALYLTNGTTDISSGDARATLRFPLTSRIRSTLSSGLQIAINKTQSITASGAVSGANHTLNGATNPTTTQDGNGNSTVGGYFEEQLSIAERLFLTGALRIDAASGFGAVIPKTVYPKASVSWLALNGPTSVRLRGAFGAAGVQPYNGVALQQYIATTAYVDGMNTSVSELTWPGNVNLKPERSQEFEGGIDVGVMNGRFNLELTAYSKHTKDAIYNQSLGATLNNLSWQANVGDVTNAGVEASIQGTVIDTRMLNWNVTVNTSHNTNKLVSVDPGTSLGFVGTLQFFRVGYPLYGFWGRPATYGDEDGNHIITPDEIHLGDTAIFLGSGTPKLETSVSNQIGLMGGALSIGALFDIRSGDVIRNGGGLQLFDGTQREQNDSTTPLYLQARAVAATIPYGTRATSLNIEKGGFVRWRELSVTYNVEPALARRFHARTLSVTTAVRNLKLWSNYHGADPEVSNASGAGQIPGTGMVNTNDPNPRGDNGAVPLSRTWSIRFNLGF